MLKYLIHASIREQQGWVFMWNRGRRGNKRVLVLFHKEVYEHLSKVLC